MKRRLRARESRASLFTNTRLKPARGTPDGRWVRERMMEVGDAKGSNPEQGLEEAVTAAGEEPHQESGEKWDPLFCVNHPEDSLPTRPLFLYDLIW